MSVGAPPRIELIEVEKTFAVTPRAEAAAVQRVSMGIDVGEVFGIIGESGAGKSTLVRLMNLLEQPTGGQILIDGEDLAALSPEALRRLRRGPSATSTHLGMTSTSRS
jgi:D-methionine transport system ATP-binding protein